MVYTIPQELNLTAINSGWIEDEPEQDKSDVLWDIIFHS